MYASKIQAGFRVRQREAMVRYLKISKIQSIVKMRKCRREYIENLALTKKNVILIQSYVRAFLCRKKYLQLRKKVLKGIVCIQATHRMRIQRRKYFEQLNAIEKMQDWVRKSQRHFSGQRPARIHLKPDSRLYRMKRFATSKMPVPGTGGCSSCSCGTGCIIS
jgi:hypothetical protein